MSSNDRMEFSDHHRSQSVFTKIKTTLEARLVHWREKNDSVDCGDIETARIRGRIAEIKGMLAEMTDNKQLGINHEHRK